MQLHDIKQVSIVDYLAQTGYKPKLIKGVNYWYCSRYAQSSHLRLKSMQSATNGMTSPQETTETSLTSFALSSTAPQQKP